MNNVKIKQISDLLAELSRVEVEQLVHSGGFDSCMQPVLTETLKVYGLIQVLNKVDGDDLIRDIMRHSRQTSSPFNLVPDAVVSAIHHADMSALDVKAMLSTLQADLPDHYSVLMKAALKHVSDGMDE